MVYSNPILKVGLKLAGGDLIFKLRIHFKPVFKFGFIARKPFTVEGFYFFVLQSSKKSEGIKHEV